MIDASTPPQARMVPRLALSGITKAYPAVVANQDIHLEVMPGEVHAVLGENGAGKSTLMKIIYGVVRPDAGEIRWEGSPVEIGSPLRARRLGIGMVFQHFSLFETLTVAENIALALEAQEAATGLAERIRTISARYGLPITPERHVHSMSVGERQRVEIVRCLLQNPRLLIMDEPTSVLTPQAVERLFATLRTLASEGVSILYISHKLDEIRALCDRATVLRGGRVTGTCNPREESEGSLARMMIGGELPHPKHRHSQPGEVRLAVKGLSIEPTDPFGTALHGIGINIRAGEVVGIAGVSGSGQQELLWALSGERPVPDAGAVLLDGEPVGRLDAGARRKRGLTFVPEERLGRGAVPDMSLTENALLTAWRHGLTERGFVMGRRVRAFARDTIAQLRVKAGGPEATARSLSGGNLQKFIVGREMRQRPGVLIAAQPTWGVDVGAAAQIRQALIDLAASGVAVLVISEELDELFEISDRIAVLARGHLSPAVAVHATSAEEIGLMMSGSFIGGGDALAA